MVPLKTVPETAIQSETSTEREEGDHPGPVEWSEEARRNVASFFWLLDQWDRQSSRRREAA